jgi:hypothetical protein
MRLTLAILLCWSVAAEPLSPRLAGDIADALWLAEGGHRARQHFGITTVMVRDYAHARAITLAVIRQEWDRWERAGRRGPFVDALCARWCPRKTDPRGNANLRRNMRLILIQLSVKRYSGLTPNAQRP